MNKNNGEFKGTVKEAIANLKADVRDLQNDIKTINKRTTLIIVLLAIALIERAPSLVSTVLAEF